MKRLFITYSFLILSIVAFADNQINILNYNLFPKETNKQGKNNIEHKAVDLVLDRTNATVYSIATDTTNNIVTNLNKWILQEKTSHKAIIQKTKFYTHYLLYDAAKSKLLAAVPYEEKHYTIIHYSLWLKENKNILHLFYIKLSENKRLDQHYQSLLNIIHELNIKERIVILGGSASNKINATGYPLQNTNQLKFKNPITKTYLYDRNKLPIITPYPDFVYLSSDLWSIEQPIHYKSNSAKILFDIFIDNPHKRELETTFEYPYSWAMESFVTNIYSTPAVEIISQDKEKLKLKIQWSKNATLQLEILSMIGNTFTKKTIAYNGGTKEVNIDISKYPTGIFILKLESQKENYRLLGRFTKY